MKYIKWLIVLLLATVTYCILSQNSAHDKLERQQVIVLPYDYAKTQPVVLGKFEEPNNQYIHVKFKFQATNLINYPNLFQTDPVNSGIRIEAHDSTLSMIVADSLGVAGFILTNNLITGRWYDFEMEAENRGFVRVWLDGRSVANYKSSAISMELTNVIFGAGFDRTRLFKGYLRDIKFITGNRVKPLLEPIRSISSNFLILILILATILSTLSIIGYRFIFSYKYHCNYLNAIKLVATGVMVLLQLVLVVCLPPYEYVSSVFAFLLVLGSGFYYIFTPLFLRVKYSCLVLSPIYGLAIISIIGASLIACSLNVRFLLPFVIILSLVFHVINYINKHYKMEVLFENLKSDGFRLLSLYTCILTPVILVLISPVLSTDYSTSAYRVGPDLATYAKMTQYLLDGGTLSDEFLRLKEFVNMTPGEINRYSNATMSWPLMYFFRWGLVAYQVVVSIITNTKHSYETLFISMIVPYLLLSGLVLIWLYRLMNLTLTISALGAIVFLFNSNLLNLWYEGFYANLYAMPFIVLILLTYQYLRGGAVSWGNGLFKTIVMLAVLMSACLLSYPEIIVFVSGAFLIIIFAVDLLMRRVINYPAYLVLLSSLLLALLVIYPYGFFIEWATLAFKQITQEGANGYPQPFWAFPHEILGLANIYFHSSLSLAGQLLHRPIVNMALALTLSFMTLFILLQGMKIRWRADNAIFIASIFMMLIFACYVYVKSPSNNYAYMKIYIFLLPLLFIEFWKSLTELSKGLLGKHLYLKSVNYRYTILWVATLVILNGSFYIFKYTSESSQISKPEIELHAQLRNINFDNVIIYPASLQKIRYIYPAILSAPWLVPEEWNKEHWGKKPYYLNYLDNRVYVFVEKDDSSVCPLKKEQIIFENPNFLIADSGLTVKQSLNLDGDAVNFNIFTNSIYCNKNT